MYLNDMPLGQRGSFAHLRRRRGGAAVLRQGRQQRHARRSGDDRRRHPVAVGALAVQQPGALHASGATSCCRRWPTPATSTQDAADARGERAAGRRAARARSRSAVLRRLRRPDARRAVSRPDHDDDAGGRRVHDARPAPAAARAGRRARRADAASTSCSSRRKRKGKAEAALIAVDPKNRRDSRVRRRPLVQPVAVQPRHRRRAASRDRSSSRSSTSPRSSRRSPTGRTDVTPASIIDDEPETFEFDDQVWTPENYENEYDGPITFRHALAHSRNLATIHVAQAAGYDHVAALWKKLGVGNPPKAYPSIALGVFEATPFEIATAYTLFPNSGVDPAAAAHPDGSRSGGKDVTKTPPRQPRARRAAGHDVSRHEHDAQRAQRRHRRAGARAPASRSTPPARPARPTICATPGSSASRPSC